MKEQKKHLIITPFWWAFKQASQPVKLVFDELMEPTVSLK